jgi:Zn-dependent peptidase ImmA (M78 family)
MALNTSLGVPGDRQRFSAAHELGHILIVTNGGLDAERACNRFAGAFLAPRQAVLRELGAERACLDLAELEMLKEKYGMSMQAWIHRAEELGIITAKAARRLRTAFRGEARVTEPGPQVPQESPKRLRLLVRRALAEGIISRSRAAELLGGEMPEPSPAGAHR